MPPPCAGSRATDSDGNGNGPNIWLSWVIARWNSGTSASRMAGSGAPIRSLTPFDGGVGDRERADGHAHVARRVDVRVQVRVPDDAAGGSAGSPDTITVCLAGAMTVRSTSIASLVALSAGKLIMSSVCQPKPRCQASSGSAEPK